LLTIKTRLLSLNKDAIISFSFLVLHRIDFIVLP